MNDRSLVFDIMDGKNKIGRPNRLIHRGCLTTLKIGAESWDTLHQTELNETR